MHLRLFCEPQQGLTYDDQLRAARTAEACGFDAFFRSDHYLAMGEGDGLPGPTDSWVTLAGLARETTTIRLGTLVSSATFRRPGPTAVAVAQVDAMSSGRVEFGLGSGWFEAEHTAYGIPFPEIGDRFDLFEDSLAVITGLWATGPGQTFSYAGPSVTVTDSPGLPKPVQHDPFSGGPPIIIGGQGKRRTPALAARCAAEFNVAFTSVAAAETQFSRVDAACAAEGRDPESLIRSVALATVVGRDEEEFRRRAAAIGREPAELREHGFAGTPAEVLDTLGTWAERTGVSRAYLQMLDLSEDAVDHVELIAAEIMPHLP
ncbi:LLM class F420-dependent oxidoreductase [Ornithinimicrobium ciconiae]|uniref:LLM class F420-dependent oxidoreductase n=1 Tax=Ornithinimicrobium ciconiae TaxID=2594265 RepID=A0A516G7Z8_9MICO|nr:LLM class F420-dependent oxidoreductase [Ornithinimicrobium ciconiae]QDO87648.1 LLM class F420-dependent oxidoreductase [Ornithinimicrobium ciconiae]